MKCIDPCVAHFACGTRPQATIQFSLKDTDISIRKRALDLLYTMCDVENSKEIVAELLTYLDTADYAIRDELVRGRGGDPSRGAGRLGCIVGTHACLVALMLLVCLECPSRCVNRAADCV